MTARSLTLTAISLVLTAGLIGCEPEGEVVVEEAPETMDWKQHEMERPHPDRAEPVPQNLPAPVPEGAVVLFDGSDLSQWETPEGEPAPWKVENGYFEVVPGEGAIQTKASFGDVQLHVEWASPDPPAGTGQDRGNSGIFLMNRYEIQVLDSYDSDTYADGQAGAIYGQYPPLFNATRPPGEWQSYDIYFRRPRFGADGSVTEPARFTVVHNGVLIQNNEELEGLTAWIKTLPYEAHEDAAPIQLQDHGSPVRFRNIWLREIPERPAPPADYASTRTYQLSAEALDRFTGSYSRSENEVEAPITITREGNTLMADFYYRQGALELVPVSENEFELTDTDGRVVFNLNEQGVPTSLTFYLGGAEIPAWRTEQPM